MHAFDTRLLASHTAVGADERVRAHLQKVGQGTAPAVAGGNEDVAPILGQPEGNGIGADHGAAPFVTVHLEAVGHLVR